MDKKIYWESTSPANPTPETDGFPAGLAIRQAAYRAALNSAYHVKHCIAALSWSPASRVERLAA